MPRSAPEAVTSRTRVSATLAWLRAQAARHAPRLRALADRLSPRLPPLALDFARPQARPSGPGVAVLACGAALLALALMQSDLHRERIESLDAELRALGVDRQAERDRARRRAPPTADTEERVRKANRVIRLLSPPWEDVFLTLEAENGKDVALLAVEPDPATAQVRVSAEARDTLAMLDYLERLRLGGRLSPAVLQSHQIVTEDPNRPLRFGFTASWNAARSTPN